MELFSTEGERSALPFPIQAQAWPCALAGFDVIAVAPTGRLGWGFFLCVFFWGGDFCWVGTFFEGHSLFVGWDRWELRESEPLTHLDHQNQVLGPLISVIRIYYSYYSYYSYWVLLLLLSPTAPTAPTTATAPTAAATATTTIIIMLMQEVAKPWLFCCLPWCISWLNLSCSRVKVPLHWCWNPPASWQCKLIMCHGPWVWGMNLVAWGWDGHAWLPLGGGWNHILIKMFQMDWSCKNCHQLDDHEKVLRDFGWCSWLQGMMMQGILSWRLGGLFTRVVCSFSKILLGEKNTRSQPNNDGYQKCCCW